jgi:nitrogen regulatory protein PII-like uncharacterized protein
MGIKNQSWMVTIQVADGTTLNEVEDMLHEAISNEGYRVMEIHLHANRVSIPEKSGEQ